MGWGEKKRKKEKMEERNERFPKKIII